MTTTAAAVEAVWRIESGRLVAALARRTGDFSAAEDLAQDALEIALRQWPRDGIPEHPASWLMATAKHVAADRYRRQTNLNRKLAVLAHQESVKQSQERDPMATVDDHLDTAVHDDLLRLIFTACHPALSTDSQVALTLRTLGGLQTKEIARAFLTSEATMGQRISRAKRTLTEQRVRFELPPADQLPTRLEAVLGVIYLVFNEGYSATAGDDWTRPALCQDALRLGRVLVGLQPQQAEVHGLVALMELQSSRLPARTGPDGEPVLLADQDRRRWDQLLIARGLAALDRAEGLGGGAFTLQAAIAACHARAVSVEDTDWRRIAALYTVLAHLTPSSVVLLNRAVAVGMSEGAARGLEEADRLRDEATLAGYPQLPAVRGTFLQQLGRHDQARAEFERAAALTSNAGERRLYLQSAVEADRRQ
ncbi:MAG TPA: RNA polymerase sigma factor [Propionibacteriaceae bacterium]|nr:RNA polymerase sigma factor [Propionibacteriaceae bacterium]